MKATYSLITLLSVSLVAAGPVPIRHAELLRRTEHLGEAPAPAHPAPAPAVAPAPEAAPPAMNADAEAKKAAEEKAGKLNFERGATYG